MVNLTRPMSRRCFIRGSGAVISLPLLASMLPSGAHAADRPMRVGFTYVPQGMVMTDQADWWTPATAGADFAFSRTLKPLEKYRQQVTVVSNLTGAEGTGQHAGAAAAWLTDTFHQMTDEPQLKAGISIDQAIAGRLGKTPIPSLQLATEGLGGLVGLWHTGYSCAYLNAISWESPTKAMPMETRARAVFERMFGSSATVEQQAQRIGSRRSILDSVRDDTHRLNRRLGTDDRARVDGYLEGIRSVERQIQASETTGGGQTGPQRFSERTRLMFNLLHLALQGDSTRVFSFMMAREMSQMAYPEIGVHESHHALTHHQNSPETMEKLGRVNRHHVELLAEFVDKLGTTPEGEGTLLDRTLLVYGSGMSNGNDHTKSRLPIALVGGLVRGNRHIMLTHAQPIGDLHLDVARQVGVNLPRFGQRNQGQTVGLS